MWDAEEPHHYSIGRASPTDSAVQRGLWEAPFFPFDEPEVGETVPESTDSVEVRACLSCLCPPMLTCSIGGVPESDFRVGSIFAGLSGLGVTDLCGAAACRGSGVDESADDKAADHRQGRSAGTCPAMVL